MTAYSIVTALAFGVFLGCFLIPRALMFAATAAVTHAHRGLAEAEQRWKAVKEIGILAHQDAEKLIAEHAAREGVLKTLQEETVDLISRGIIGGIDARIKADRWEAVARNLAVEHPEGKVAFLRIAQAHGLEVTQ